MPAIGIPIAIDWCVALAAPCHSFDEILSARHFCIAAAFSAALARGLFALPESGLIRSRNQPDSNDGSREENCEPECKTLPARLAEWNGNISEH